MFIKQHEHLLLIKYAAVKESWAGYFNGIGGHLEAGESPYQAAIREVREETGLECTNLQIRALITIDTGITPGILLFIFLAELEQHSLPELRCSAEGEVTWVRLNELDKLPLLPDLHRLLPRILTSLPTHQGPLTGHYSYQDDGTLDIYFDNPK